MPRVRRKDIRLSADQEKVQVYEAVDQLYHQGQVVTVKEHRSGFPAVTLDCGDLHYLTDCISLEVWWHQHQLLHDQLGPGRGDYWPTD